MANTKVASFCAGSRFGTEWPDRDLEGASGKEGEEGENGLVEEGLGNLKVNLMMRGRWMDGWSRQDVLMGIGPTTSLL